MTRNTEPVESQRTEETGILKYLVAEEEKSRLAKEKYFKSQHFHYYEGYNHAIQNVLERVRESIL